MPLVNLKPWLACAQHEKFAIGAFNANTLEQMQAVVAGAQAERAPAILQVSHRALEYIGSGNTMLGLRYMAELGKVAAQSVDVPIGLHLDHANEQEVVQALALGFTSAMFDCAELSLGENIAVTQKLCDLAHAVGAGLEGEVGAVPKPDAAGNLVMHALTEPDDAAEFVRATRVDALAIALGSSHAGRAKTVSLDLERLRAIQALVNVPLVLHGSSGVRDEHITQGIALGLAKVNVATQLNQAFTGALRAALDQNGDQMDPRQYLAPARLAMSERVRERIRFFGSGGKA